MSVFFAVYRIALSFWIGGIAIFTFVVTPTIFRTQGRDAAGKIVGAIFPIYFRYGLFLGAIALLARVFSGEAFQGVRRSVGTFVILTAVLLASYHTYGIAPRLEQVKASIASFETTSPDDPARKEFSRLHGVSMGINLVILLEGVALLVGHELSGRSK